MINKPGTIDWSLSSVAPRDLVVAYTCAIAVAVGLGAILAISISSNRLWIFPLLGALSLAGAAGVHGMSRGRYIAGLKRDLLDKDGYRLFVQNAIQGFFRVDAEGRFLEVNAALAQMCGYDSAAALLSALQQDPGRLYVDERGRKDFVAQVRAQGMVKDFISKIRRCDGRALFVAENARAVFDASGKLLFYEGTLQDITAQRESHQAMRQALKEAQDAARAKSAFIAATSHELKTPLNAIIGFSELMLQQVFGPVPERYHSYLSDIHGAGQRLLALISNVLDFARFEGGAIALNETLFPVNDLLADALHSVIQFRSDLPAISVKEGENLPLLSGDRKRIFQVFVNLLSNAVKFTPATGRVSVRTRLGADQSLLVEIADTGIGMEGEQLAMALEPFRQIDNRISRRFEGLGLGLPLAKAWMELHGGRLSITSEIGKGTTVNLAFPPDRLQYPNEPQRPFAALSKIAS